MAGNTSVSSLMGSVASARSKQQAYDDAFAGYQYDSSSKTENDLQAYTGYLKTRQGQVTDPSKQLEIQKQIQGATKSYSSATIRRAGDSVMLGESDNTAKANTIYNLMQQAYASGDSAYGDQLQSQWMSLSKTIQQEGITAQNQARAAGEKRQGSNGDSIGYATALAKRGQQLVDEAIRNGQMSPQEAADRKYNSMEQERQTYEKALAGGFGDLSESKQAEIQNSLFSLVHGKDYAVAKAHEGVGVNGMSDQYIGYDKVGDTFMNKVSTMPGGKTEWYTDNDGKQHPFTTYAGGYGDLNAKDQGDAIKKAGAFNKSGKPFIIEQAVGGQTGGPDVNHGVLAHVGLGEAAPDVAQDGTTNPYDVVRRDMRVGSQFFGTPHYVNTDPTASLQLSHSAITKDDMKLGKPMTAMDYLNAVDDNTWNNAKQLPHTIMGAANALGHLNAGQVAGNAMHGLGGVLNAVASGNAARAAAAKISALRAQQAAQAAAHAAAQQAASRAAMAAAAVRGKAVAAQIGPRPTPAQFTAAIAKPTAAPTVIPRSLAPVQNYIDLGIAAQKKAPAPAPVKQWWNPTTWFK